MPWCSLLVCVCVGLAFVRGDDQCSGFSDGTSCNDSEPSTTVDTCVNGTCIGFVSVLLLLSSLLNNHSSIIIIIIVVMLL
jgi:hypothetical protein